MKRLPFPLLVVILMLLAGATGYLMQQNMQTDSVSEAEDAPVGINPLSSDMLFLGLPRPDFTLPDLDGNPRSISEWDGKIIVLNFWATWCPPCREELPTFVELQEKYGDQGLQFIGVAVDAPENVRDFMNTIPLNYPNLVDEMQAMKIAAQYGNNLGALPFTVIIDREKRIAFTRKGDIKPDEARKLIGELFN